MALQYWITGQPHAGPRISRRATEFVRRFSDNGFETTGRRGIRADQPAAARADDQRIANLIPLQLCQLFPNESRSGSRPGSESAASVYAKDALNESVLAATV